MESFSDARNAQALVAAWDDPKRSVVGKSIALRGGLLALGLFAVASPARAGGLTVDSAWVAPNDKAGADVGLFMTIKNDADEPDALMRASCPFANFSERRTVDVGEGGLADRAVPNIPVAAHATLTLTPKSYHIGLLQTRDPLAEGQSFTCNLSFRRAGAMEVKVTVSPSAP